MTGLPVVRSSRQWMQRPETNDGQQLQGGVPGLAATVMLTNIGSDGQADRRHEPLMAESDRPAYEKSSQRL